MASSFDPAWVETRKRVRPSDYSAESEAYVYFQDNYKAALAGTYKLVVEEFKRKANIERKSEELLDLQAEKLRLEIALLRGRLHVTGRAKRRGG